MFVKSDKVNKNKRGYRKIASFLSLRNFSEIPYERITLRGMRSSRQGGLSYGTAHARSVCKAHTFLWNIFAVRNRCLNLKISVYASLKPSMH